MKIKSCLLAAAAFLALLASAAVIFVWTTIPAAPDPDTLPSHVLAEPAPAHLDAVEVVRAEARALVSEEKIPGLAVAVALDGAVAWAEGFGWADLETREEVTPDTRFRVGGVAECLGSALVGRLVERGVLDLDAPVQTYLPDHPRSDGPVTLRRLMSHTAGLPPYRGEGGILRGTCADDADRLALFADRPPHAPPGTGVRYSTNHWVLAGAAVAAAAGAPYLELLEREILVPLGMDATGPELADVFEPGSARHYYPRMMLDPRYGLQDAPAIDLSCYLPAVGFLSTPADLARFGAAMMGGDLLDPATAVELTTPVTLASGELTGQALGWTVSAAPPADGGAPMRVVAQGLGEVRRGEFLGITTVGGSVAGGTATLLLVPERGLAVAVACNVSAARNVPVLAERAAAAFGGIKP